MNPNGKVLIFRLIMICLLWLPCVMFPSVGWCDEAAPYGKPVGYWIKMLEDKDPAFRRTAIHTLSDLGPKAAEAVPALIAVLGDPHADIRCEAAKAIGNIGPGAKAAAPDLLALIERDNGTCVRRAAALALKKMGSAALPSMIAVLQHGNEDARFLAARAIGQLGPEAGSAVQDLVAAMGDAHANVRFAAAEALGNIGPGASEALPALAKASKDQDEDVRDIAQEAISKIQGVR